MSYEVGDEVTIFCVENEWEKNIRDRFHGLNAVVVDVYDATPYPYEVSHVAVEDLMGELMTISVWREDELRKR